MIKCPCQLHSCSCERGKFDGSAERTESDPVQMERKRTSSVAGGSGFMSPLSTPSTRSSTASRMNVIPYSLGKPKAFRHAFAVEAGSKAIPLSIVQRWLGHVRIETTAIYASALVTKRAQSCSTCMGLIGACTSRDSEALTNELFPPNQINGAMGTPACIHS